MFATVGLARAPTLRGPSFFCSPPPTPRPSRTLSRSCIPFSVTCLPHAMRVLGAPPLLSGARCTAWPAQLACSRKQHYASHGMSGRWCAQPPPQQLQSLARRECLRHALAAPQQQQPSTHAEDLPAGLLPQQLPKHVAVIMDGNSRWAAARGLPAFAGHERGVAALRGAVEAAQRWGIGALTCHAWSTENWERDATEVAFIMQLFQSALGQQLPDLQRNGVRLHFMGDLQRLPPDLQRQARECEAATAGGGGLLLSVAVSYGAQADLVSAVRSLARQVEQGKLSAEQITPELLSRHLASAPATAAAGPPDLLIRTSGELRLSNFMLWEAAYTELYFAAEMWPDFDDAVFARALREYAMRQRRYGRRRQHQA